MNQTYKFAQSRAVVFLFSGALALSGCFNNLSGLDRESSDVNSQQNVNAQIDDSGFQAETGTINTVAVFIGPYRDPAVPANIGVMIDLQKSLTTTLGAATLASLLTIIDTNSVQRARPVVIHVPGFNVKVSTTLGTLAAGNNGKLRNVMNIRPGFSRVDFSPSSLEMPASPAVLQFGNSNKTVVTYGGKIENDYIHRMMALIPFAGINGSVLPNSQNPNYGDGYPPGAPFETLNSVRLLPISSALATHFNSLFTAPQDHTAFLGVVPTPIQSMAIDYSKMALAVHLKMNGANPLLYTSGPLIGLPKIDAAFFINISPTNNTGPDTFMFCNANYDGMDLSFPWNNTQINYTHPQACNCDPALDPVHHCNGFTTSGIALPSSSLGIFRDTWPTTALAPTQQKAALIKALMTANPSVPIAPVIISAPITQITPPAVISQE